MFILDPDTGQPTLVGETGFPATSGLAFVPGGAPASADLVLTKSVDAVGQVAVGTILTYTLEVENLGPDGATGVVVVDTLPAQVGYQSNDCAAAEAAGVVTWNVGVLANGASALCNILVSADIEGSAINTAEASGNESDPVTANNVADAGITIVLGTPIPEAIPVPFLRTPSLLLLLFAIGALGVILAGRRQP